MNSHKWHLSHEPRGAHMAESCSNHETGVLLCHTRVATEYVRTQYLRLRSAASSKSLDIVAAGIHSSCGRMPTHAFTAAASCLGCDGQGSQPHQRVEIHGPWAQTFAIVEGFHKFGPADRTFLLQTGCVDQFSRQNALGPSHFTISSASQWVKPAWLLKAALHAVAGLLCKLSC
jgi:hypothetical protein